jgi:hypothetical protein
MQTPFTEQWWDQLIRAWNASPHRTLLAGLGTVAFIIEEDGATPALVDWDDRGIANRLVELPTEAPCFRASRQNWLSFIQGEFEATTGLLQGYLEFRGTLSRVVPYSLAFNQLAAVARTLEEE